MSMPNGLSRILVTLTSAVLLIALVAGGIWLTRHPIPQGGLAPVAMVAGLAAMVYGARKS
ncbi:MAG TPA: hypothetical protein VN259_14555 [Xanthomonadales bacterium]|nr:hypothetical protein [Xanthomonadales bacterium]